MVFSSVIFIFLFLPIILTLYFLIGKRFQNLLLLAASLLFYAWSENFFVLVMISSILINYMAGLLIEHFRGCLLSKISFYIAVILNLGMLSIYKYSNFIVNNINYLLSLINIHPIHLDNVHLPIGISFFTFQTITYVADVYNKKADVQKNPVNIALYIALFPQLIAGPIVRYCDVAAQIVNRSIKQDDFVKGIERFIYGLGKKVLIANPLAVTADQIFSLDINDLSTGTAWIGIVCYTFQIYFDFSGYSDMAIGLGRLFGFRFTENFNYPYASQSVQEFWRRWHISLSDFFRDYLYIPLGGDRCGTARTYFNLITVFFLCGLWHGASWNFVIWGMLHGLFLVIERMGFIRQLKKLWIPLRHIYVIFVIMTGWVFFRAETLPKAFSYLYAMFGGGKDTGAYNPAMYLDTETKIILIISAVCSTIPVLPFFEQILSSVMKNMKEKTSGVLNSISSVFHTIMLILILLASVISIAAGAYNPFIYFRF